LAGDDDGGERSPKNKKRQIALKGKCQLFFYLDLPR